MVPNRLLVRWSNNVPQAAEECGSSSVFDVLVAIFDGFALQHVRVSDDVVLRVRHGGHGPAVVLLHGHPRTHTTWYEVAPRLVEAGLTVVCPDLRGYGQSLGPEPDADHRAYSDRAMAGDITELMTYLDHEHFAVVGHDRGSYVAYRTALDHAERVITADPLAWYQLDPAVMGRENYEDAVAAVSNPRTVRAMLEDYRAGLQVDRATDEADRAVGRRITCPTLVAWSSRDDMAFLYGDPLDVWRPWCTAEPESAVIQSGHHMAEENPGQLATLLRQFLTSQ